MREQILRDSETKAFPAPTSELGPNYENLKMKWGPKSTQENKTDRRWPMPHASWPPLGKGNTFRSPNVWGSLQKKNPNTLVYKMRISWPSPKGPLNGPQIHPWVPGQDRGVHLLVPIQDRQLPGPFRGVVLNPAPARGDGHLEVLERSRKEVTWKPRRLVAPLNPFPFRRVPHIIQLQSLRLWPQRKWRWLAVRARAPVLTSPCFHSKGPPNTARSPCRRPAAGRGRRSARHPPRWWPCPGRRPSPAFSRIRKHPSHVSDAPVSQLVGRKLD